MREIGSHFEYNFNVEKRNAISAWIPHLGCDYAYTFSGRSAIELALINITRKSNVKRVYMPSYCCNSMLEPFRKPSIDILFYQVEIINDKLTYNINFDEDVDLFFAMSYFGVDQSIDPFIEEFKARGSIVIEDVTHRLLSNQSHNQHSDYQVASLRKWFAIPTGGLLVSKDELLSIKPVKESDCLVVDQLEGMKLKTNYMLGDRGISKQDYFNRFRMFNKQIAKTNYEYKIDSTSLNLLSCLNILEIKQKRRKNAKHLYDNLTEISLVKPLFENVDFKKMTPLFIPIIIRDEKTRKSLVQHLVEHQIYCPVHWPKPEIIKESFELYNREISLVCDQRYNIDDMNKIIDVIREFEINNA